MFWLEQQRRSNAQKGDRATIAQLKQQMYKQSLGEQQQQNGASDPRNLSLAVLDENDGFEGFGGPEDFEEMDAADGYVVQPGADQPSLAHNLSMHNLMEEHESAASSSYEDLVRDHIARYVRQAEQYIQETELSRRVSDWEARITPILQQEEEHEPFDIHAYGANILDRMPSVGKSKGARVSLADVSGIKVRKKKNCNLPMSHHPQ